MARTEIERTVQPSLLDRLTDETPSASADRPTTWEASVRAYKHAVQRDVEWLLNTRRTPEPAGGNFPAVRRSVFNYGLVDVTTARVEARADRDRLLEAVEEALSVFEPRLGGLHVTMGEISRLSALQVRFTVEALLRMDPSPEQVVFDTVLEIASGAYDVRGGDLA